MSLYLVEITAWDPKIQGTRVLRFGTGQGLVTPPTAVPASTYYEPCVAQPVSVTRSLFSYGSTMGRSTIGHGDLVLLNGDGELDYILDLGLDGRNITILRSGALVPRYPEDFDVVLIGTMNQPEFSGDVIRISLRDRQADLEVALQATKYAGTNLLPAGLEGVEGDLMGKPKPLCFGIVKNSDPPCVNTARLIYQVNDGPVSSVDKVYDRGVSLAPGANYADQADMEANNPAAGTYRVWPAGGYFRLGSQPAGLITADVTEGDAAANRTAARIYEALIRRASLANAWTANLAQTTLATDAGDDVVTDTGLGFLVSGDVSQSDLTALDTADSSELGFWTKEETTIAQVCDRVADTVGAWWGVDRQGVFRIQQFAAPEHGQASMVITRADMLRPLERLATNDPGRGLPIYRQIVRWGRHYVTQTTDLAASVTSARRAQLEAEWREVVVTNPDVQQRHLLSPEVIRESLYTSAADAEAEATRRLSLYDVRRDRFEIVLHLTDETSGIDLGDTVNLNHPRYGLNIAGSDDGTPFVVIGVEPDARSRRVTLNLWGSSTGLENLATETDIMFVTDTGAFLTTKAA